MIPRAAFGANDRCRGRHEPDASKQLFEQSQRLQPELANVLAVTTPGLCDPALGQRHGETPLEERNFASDSVVQRSQRVRRAGVTLCPVELVAEPLKGRKQRLAVRGLAVQIGHRVDRLDDRDVAAREGRADELRRLEPCRRTDLDRLQPELAARPKEVRLHVLSVEPQVQARQDPQVRSVHVRAHKVRRPLDVVLWPGATQSAP